jgi:hypothetical protein
MMNGQRPLFDRICQIVDLPVIGPLLYRLNVNRIVIHHEYERGACDSSCPSGLQCWAGHSITAKAVAEAP